MRKIYIRQVISPQDTCVVEIRIEVLVCIVTMVIILKLTVVLKHYINYHECSPTPDVYLLIGVCSDHYNNGGEYFGGVFISSYSGFDGNWICWGSPLLISILSFWNSTSLYVCLYWW